MRRGPALFLLFCLLFGAAYGAWRIGQEGYDRLTHFQPYHATAERPTVGSAPLADRLVLLVIDGLRAEEAHLLPSLDWLRRKGAGYRLAVPGPSYSPTVFATLLSGAPPTWHGGLGMGNAQPPPVDHLLQAAARTRTTAGGAGSPALGRLTAGTLEAWHEGESVAVLSEGIQALLKADGPRLVLIQVGDLLQSFASTQRAANPATAYRDGLAELDTHLVTIFDQIDWKSTAVMVVGSTPVNDEGRRDEGGHVPLLLAGSGVLPGAGGDATLLDVAPTAAALLGLPTPLEAQGSPILSALHIEGRPLDAIMQVYLTSRRALAESALQAYGSSTAPAQVPATATGAEDYLAQLEQQVKEARYAWTRAGLVARLPYLGGGVLLLLLYLLILYRRPFGGPALAAHLTYSIGFHALFFGMGGRYGSDLAGSDLPLRELAMRFGLLTAGAALLAALVGGLLLSRKEYKRSRYLAACGLHTALGLVVLTALPVAVGLLITGWDFPVALPATGLWIWFFLTVLQVVLIGGLSPVWAWVTVRAARFGQRQWPPREIGNPEVNADKVVRLRALRRADRRPL